MDTRTDSRTHSRTDSNIRLLLRILSFPFVSILFLYFCLNYVNEAGFFRILEAPNTLKSLFLGLMLIANLLLVYGSFAYFVERRPITELALPRMGRELGVGLLLGFGLMTLCILIAMALGLYRIEGIDNWQNLLPRGIALSLPFQEELLHRGVVLGTLERMFGGWVALVVSSVVFGLVHLINEGENLAGIASIVFVYGPMLAAPYLLTRRLWVGIGLHCAWNYTMGKIYSVNVSGNESEGLFKATFQGPELLTGGSAGMEGSLIAMLVGITFAVLTLILAVRRGKIVPPPRKREA